MVKASKEECEESEGRSEGNSRSDHGRSVERLEKEQEQYETTYDNNRLLGHKQNER